MEPYVVRQQIDIKAKPEQVWDALTNPEKTRQYFFHCRVLSHWKQGSTIRFKGRIFLVWPIELEGKILEIITNRLLKYTLKNKSSKDENSFSTVTDELNYSNGITTLSITDDVGSGEEAKKRYERSVEGWKKVLKGLKQLVENEASAAR